MSVTPARRRQTIVASAVVGAVAVAIIAAVAVGTGSSTSPDAASSASSTSPTPTPTPTPSAAPTLTPGPGTLSGELTQENASAALAGYYEALDGLSGDTDLEGFTSSVQGAALSELEAQQIEYAANGWTMTGRPRIEGVTVLSSDSSATPPTVTVQACLDSSDVRVLRTDGEPAFGVDPQVVRALNVFVFASMDGKWTLVDHTFPDDADC